MAGEQTTALSGSGDRRSVWSERFLESWERVRCAMVWVLEEVRDVVELLVVKLRERVLSDSW